MLKHTIECMEDIDSDDEEPEIEMHLVDAGLKFFLFRNISKATYLKCFYMFEKHGLKERLPNLYNYVMRNVHKMMETQGTLREESSSATPLDHHLFDLFASIDLSRAVSYMNRPPEN
eukprot:CAMPEP_0170510722 /NCGR_PEP_ID=MMETSP0208-20121228/65921_1 /TAXON_ID=197538 /ORGANISM="Strombidium inclinatum, Strain S3" /LENGTH=116 /DNA_ID=CAMNT_0010794209 /DNA_START=1097 /DNA_END=1447 /DNA_ORIENTATION=-